MRYVTAAELAKRLNVNIRTVQLWAKNGKLPGAKKPHRDWLIPIPDDEDAESLPVADNGKDAKKASPGGFAPSTEAADEAHPGGAAPSETTPSETDSGRADSSGDAPRRTASGGTTSNGAVPRKTYSGGTASSGIMPLLNASFEVGKCVEYIDSIKDAEIADIAWAEYYYFSAQPGKAVQMSEKYMESPDLEKRLSASLIYIFANLSLGRIAAVNKRIAAVREDVKRGLAREAESRVHALCAFMSDTINILFHLPTDFEISRGIQAKQSVQSKQGAQATRSGDASQTSQGRQTSQTTQATRSGQAAQADSGRSDAVSPKTHLRFLPGGLKLFACYVLAHKAYFEQNYAQSLGIIETALAWQDKIYPIATIYIHLVAVMDLMCLGEKERARKHFMQAWEIARPDNLIQPIGEHHGLTYGLIETCLKNDFPEDYRKVIEVTYRFSEGWRNVHNAYVDRPVTGNLTTTEFTISMLAKRGWSNRQIADYMGLSVHTVKQYMSIIFQKLGITSRKQISDHMLK